MKAINLLVLIMLLVSCASSKKVIKAEVHTESDLIGHVQDSSTISTAWEDLLSILEKTIDLSTIHIVSYYPEKDTTTGKQLVKEEVTVQKNVTATKETVQQEKADVKETTKIVTDITQKVKQEIKQEVLQKKGSSNLKLYIIIALLGLTVLGIVYLWVRRIIKF